MTGDAIPPLLASTFEPYVGSAFAVDDEGGATVTLVLSGVEVPPDLDEGDVCFALVFLGPTDSPIDQRIHTLCHEVLGALELFLVPVGATEAGIRYEALFNNPAAARELML